MNNALTPRMAAAQIELFAKEGRLIQGKWSEMGADGRQFACILGAIDLKIQDVGNCPASVMPPWAASLLINLFDRAQRDRAITLGVEFASLLRKTENWTNLEWDRVKILFLIECVKFVLNVVEEIGEKDYYYTEIRVKYNRIILALESDDQKKIRVAAGEAFNDWILGGPKYTHTLRVYLSIISYAGHAAIDTAEQHYVGSTAIAAMLTSNNLISSEQLFQTFNRIIESVA